jgi:nucleoside phosphorylase
MGGLDRSGLRVLVIPTRWERRAALRALMDAQPDPRWDVPAWRWGDLLIVESGMGPAKVRGLLTLFDSLALKEIWLFGCCGALIPELDTGDLVLADATVYPGRDVDSWERTPYPPSEHALAAMRRFTDDLNAKFIVGPVLTSDRILASEAEKRAAAQSGGVAVEMEAGPLARWAAARNVPFLHIRVVLDPLTPTVSLPVDAHGRASLRPLLLFVMRHPRRWPSLWQLARQVGKTDRRMTEVMAGLVSSK